MALKQAKVFLVTSVKGGTGKTITALNLAVTDIDEKNYRVPKGFISISNGTYRNENNDGTYNTACGRNINSNCYCNVMKFDADIGNVKNYDEFLYALQHDTKFEKIVRAMTTDKIFGGSMLKKYKY